jgi:carboxyl-terminal processing protease
VIHSGKMLLVAGVAGVVAAAWMSSGTPAAQADATSDYLKTFSQILDLVETRYVDEVPSDQLVEGAIRGMLRTLDPHSNYLEARAYKEMREEQRGSFSGLGIVISLRGDENLLTVISPIEGTPAFRAGIRAGDVIAEIEGEDTMGMSIDDALSRLRGPKGSQVSFKIRREGSPDLTPYTLTRDDIPTNSIQFAYMIQPKVGYIRIKNFTQTTDQELGDKIRELQAAGMERLVLDLRWNPGGLLDQAVKVASHFLPPGDEVVFTRGRTDRSNEEYRVPETGEHVDLPMVVLINRGSASASEIVTGAIQDHDRGLVVGETSWGKGLVQTVYNLSYDAALALTTARYYTPSGRLIQRDYHSLEDYFSPSDDDDTPAGGDPEVGGAETFHTDAGRNVYGGGGIHPDVKVPLDDLSKTAELLERKAAFFEFATRYRGDHGTPPEQATFQVDDALLGEFRAYLAEKKIDVTDDDMRQNDDYIRRALKAEIFSNYFGLEARNQVLAEGDKQLQEALRLFPQAEKLTALRAEVQAHKGAAGVPN